MTIAERIAGSRSWIILGTIVIVIIAIVGLFVYFNQAERYPPPPSGWTTIRPPYVVLALAEQSDVIWAGGSDGLIAIDRDTGSLTSNTPKEWAEFKYVRDLYVDRLGALWIAYETGLTRLNKGQQQTYTVADGLPRGFCAAVIEDSKGNIWVGTETGLARFDGQTWQDLTAVSGFGKIPITLIYEDSEGTIWFGSDSMNNIGLMCYDGEEWASFTVNEGLTAHNTVTDIIEDKDGNMWVASGLGNSGGATCIKNNGVLTLTMEDGLRGARVRSLFQDSLGRFWFGSEYDGSAIFDGEERYVVSPEQGLAGWEVMEMIEDNSGVLWLATENGITRIESVNDVPSQ